MKQLNSFQSLLRCVEIYHGSDVEIMNPRILTFRFTKDFGYGFYCTNIKEQARRWATKKPTPIVTVYNYRGSKDLNIKKFDEMTEEWLDFIIDCRLGGKHDYDIVIGPMADDQIYLHITELINGLITRDHFWYYAKFNYPTHQICFCTEKSLDCLEFVKSYSVKESR